MIAEPRTSDPVSARSRRPAFPGALLAALLVLVMSTPSALAGEPAPPGATTTAADRKAAAKKAAQEEIEARERLIESIRVIQQRPFLHALRFELQLMGGVGVNDQMFRHVLGSATGRFHITEAWSLAVGYTHYWEFKSPVHDALVENYELFPERSFQRWNAILDVGWSPIYGKFPSVNDEITHFDIYITLGGGLTQTNRSADFKPTGMVGVGWRILINKWFTFLVEVRDHIYVENFNAGDEVINNVILQAGFSFFMPFDYDYDYSR